MIRKLFKNKMNLVANTIIKMYTKPNTILKFISLIFYSSKCHNIILYTLADT